MENSIRLIFDLCEECVQSALALKACVEEERAALILLQTDVVLEKNVHKETLLAELVQKRKDFRAVIAGTFGIPDSEKLIEKLPESFHAEWKALQTRWLEVWKQTAAAIEVEALFIGHSQRNLTALTDHLKRLFCEPGNYSAKGTRNDKPGQGRVVEASY